MDLVQSASPDIKVTRGSLKKVPSVLSSLVEEPTKRHAVPSHLLESKMYSECQRSRVVQAEPAVLHYGGYEVGKHHQQMLKLINISTNTVNLHIIPPQTIYFQIKYNKIVSVRNTALSLVCPLWLLLIFALMNGGITMTASEFTVSKEYVIPLQCSCPIDFEFHIDIIQPHRAFRIIPANGKVKVTVKYSPLEYGTAQMAMQLRISEFHSKPYVCVFTGTSIPHLALIKEYFDEQQCHPEKKSVSGKPVLWRRDQFSQLQLKPMQKLKEIEYQNLRFPTDLSNPYAVATVLIQEPAKLKLKDIKEALSQGKQGKNSRQMKDALFQLKVKQNVQEEEANHLKWQIHKGSDPISVEFKKEVIKSRRREEEQYKLQRGDPIIEQEFQRTEVEVSLRRVTRHVDQQPSVHPTFDLLHNDPWDSRKRMLRKFQQAAYKILVQIRLNRLLLLFRGLPREARGLEEGSVSESRSLSRAEKSEEHKEFSSRISEDRILPFEFPFYSSHELHSYLAPDALGLVPIESVDVKVEHIFPFYDLKVPQHCNIMKYQPFCTHYAATSYKPVKLNRPLRQGAQDELIQVVPSPEGQLSHRKDFDKAAAEGDISLLNLVPPQALVHPIEINPLRIFNPIPGLVPFIPPLAYCESNIEYHLCPHPKYTVTKECPRGSSIPVTQKKFLDHKEVICGVMEWRKFSPLEYSTFSNIPTLTNTALRDPYSSDMLPRDVPPVLNDLPERDKENIIDHETHEAEFNKILTPEMVKAEFPQIGGALSKEDEEESAKIESEAVLDGAFPGDPQNGPDGHFQLQNSEIGEKIRKHLETLKLKALNKTLILG
ncbi:hypothetical protein DV515_00005659 [Chloebia gouldiae]|uniref:Cilia and flagella associated protein 221 n=1 Tax=Chloebia gouldiae TaxID=44316 RepID=A0A3L8SPN2_CHLGU|nr:hypothetical protein DV515_00005659 [Chloebia gouldiae]